jgi:AraC-like DNA-binding protein
MRSIEFMVRHLDKPLQVARLAAEANISLSHYFAVFKEVTGFTPMDYFTRLRMHRACRLLDDTPMSVKEVAATLGYDDPFYFSRVFKAFHDMAPSEYRLLPPRLKANPDGTTVTLPDETVIAGSCSALRSDIESPGEAVLTSTRRDHQIVESA